MLLCSDWPEKGKWESRQLQRVYFQTMNGGEEFFVRLSALPAGKGEVREVYLYCLAMGFKGRFFSPDDEKELAEISRVHLPLIHDLPETGDRLLLHGRTEPDGRASLHNLSEPDGLPEMLFPEAYDAASGRRGRSPWRHGLSFLHLVVMAGSLLFLISLFVSLKNNLGHLVQAYILGA